MLLTALEMMRAKAGAQTEGEDTEVNITSIGIVPLGIPLLAGPGAIVTTIVDATALSSTRRAPAMLPAVTSARARTNSGSITFGSVSSERRVPG